MITTNLPLPLRALLLKDGTGTVLVRHGDSVWVPLFTSDQAAHDYIREVPINDGIIVELRTPDELRDFIRNRPSRSQDPSVKSVVLDPRIKSTELVSFTFDQILTSH